MNIHETAIVSKKAEIDPEARIGPWSVIEDEVKIGPGVELKSGVHVHRGTEIGEGTVVHKGAVLGNEPQDHAYKGQVTYTRIGKNNVIREYVTVHRGTDEGSATVVGDNNYLMVQCHLGHNCHIEDNVIIANGALLAGHVKVEKGAFISGNVVFHQYCRIGRYAMIGGFTGVNKDVPPFLVVRGPSAVRGVNLVGLRRAGCSRQVINEIKEAHRLLYMSNINMEEALEKLKNDFSSKEVAYLVSFIESSKRGICRYRYSREEYFE